MKARRVLKLRFQFLAVLLLAAATPARAQVPFIAQPLVPAAATPGGSDFNLTVNGTGFVTGSVVDWNGNGLITTFVSSTQLTATVPAIDIASAGTAAVTVVNPAGARSNVAYFEITSSASFTFTESDYATPSPATTVAVGDFNGDGILDLAVAGSGSSSISILLGKSDGTFTSGQSVSVGISIYSLTVGDFNGDGDLDLAVGTDNGQSIVVLLGTGTGTFGSPNSFTAGHHPRFIAVGDLNGDGKLDLAVSNNADNTVSVLLGNGDGTFQSALGPVSVGSTPEGLAVGDFNRDGNLDVAVATGGGVFVLLGNGTGKFTSPLQFPIGTSSAYSVAVEDLNGDGIPDLVVGAQSGQAVSVLKGNGTGSFSTATFATGGSTPQSVLVGDVNGDGIPDLIVGNAGSGTVSVLLGDGGGNFGTATTLTLSSTPQWVAVGDFNGDGRLDIAAAIKGGVAILSQTQPPPPPPPPTPAVSLTPTTLNFGTLPLGTSAQQSSTLTNTGTGTLNLSSIVLSGADYSLVATGTSCPYTGGPVAPGGTCTIDVALKPTQAGTRVGTVTLTDDAADSPQTLSLTGTGLNPGPFISQPLIPESTSPGGSDFTLTVNGTGFVSTSVVNWNNSPLSTTFVSSGRLKAVVPSADIAQASTAAVTVFNAGPGGGTSNVVYFEITNATTSVSFGTAINYAAGLNPMSVAVGDFNGDGVPDLVVANNGDGTISVFMGNGDGTFQQTPTNYSVGPSPWSVAVGDFNGDNYPDLVVGTDGGSAFVLLNKADGTGSFGSAVSYSAGGSRPRFVAIGDFNGDGVLDLALSNFGNNTVGILQGVGDGTFKPLSTTVALASGANPAGLAVGDFNGDGQLDLAVAESGTGSVSILLGKGNGTFSAGQPVKSGGSPNAIAVGDFNGDGFLDLAVAKDVNTTVVNVFSGFGDGTFNLGDQIPADISPVSLAVGDFNGDGILDLAVANNKSNDASVLLNNGNRNFQTPLDFKVGQAPQWVAVGDFNNDGRLDMAVVTANGITVLLQTGGAVSATTTSISAPPINFGDQANISVSVTSSGGTVTGNVSLTVDNGSPIAQTLSSGSTVFVISGLAGGSHNLVANFAGQGNFGASSATAILQVNPIAPTVTLAVPATAGFQTTFTVTASTNASTMPAITASGPCFVGPISGSPAMTTVPVTMTASSGICMIDASWPADNNYLAGSASTSVTATQADTKTVITSNVPNPSVTGQSVTIKVNVMPAPPGGGTPTGTVTISDGVQGEQCTTAAPTGSCSITFGPAGTRTLVATYSGDPNFSASTSAGVSQTVLASGFIPNGNLNTARYSATATLLNNGTVLVAGGSDTSGNSLASAELYDPATGVFTFTGSLNTPRYYDTATLLNNGKVLIVGGHCMVSGTCNGPVATAEVYDPATGTFTVGAAIPVGPLQQHTATLLNDGTVLVAGGFGQGGASPNGFIYDPTTASFSLVGKLTTARYNAGATLLDNGMVMIAGGHGPNGAVPTIELYNPTTQTFSSGGKMQTQRELPTLTLLNNSQVLIAGGEDANGNPLDSAEVYDPATQHTTLTSTKLDTLHVGHTATMLTNAMPLIAGGYNGSSYLQDAELFDSSADAFEVVNGLNVGRAYHTATLLNSGMVLVAGGQTKDVNNNVVATNSVELYETDSLTPSGLVSINVKPPNPNFALGTSQHVTATGTFSDNSTETLVSVIWSSSDNTVATLTNDSTNLGGLYGVGAGTATIKACAGSICGSTSITVTSGQAPAFTSNNNANFTVGTQSSFTVTTTGNPTPSITESGPLPPGVGFTDNGDGTGTLSGIATATGTFNVTFTAQNGVSPNATQSFALIVSQNSSVTALASSANPSTFGQTVTFTATVTQSSGHLTPTGNVTFSDGSTTLGTVPLDATGNATFSTSSLAQGTHAITANYSGDPDFTPSSASLQQTVNPNTTAISLASNPNPSFVGQPVTFTAVAKPTSPGGLTPTGTVVFVDGATNLGSAPLDSSGTASISAPLTAAGTHTIAAKYSGDQNFTPSSSSLLQGVNPAATTASLVLSSGTNPSIYGQTLVFTASVKGQFGGQLTGTVAFLDGSTTLGSVPLSSGTANFATATLAAGTHSITAVYSGDPNFTGSTSAALSQTVNKATTTTTISASPNPAALGQAVTFTAAVVSSTGAIPNGNVTFAQGSSVLGTAPLDSTGHASIATSSLMVGNNNVTASYAGSANFLASTSTSVTEVVNKVPTTTKLASSPNPSAFKQSVTFTATVTSATGGIPTGTVTFLDGNSGNQKLGSSTLNSSGQASFTTSGLGHGTHNVTAAYGGDSKFANSTSAILVQTVN